MQQLTTNRLICKFGAFIWKWTQLIKALFCCNNIFSINTRPSQHNSSHWAPQINSGSSTDAQILIFPATCVTTLRCGSEQEFMHHRPSDPIESSDQAVPHTLSTKLLVRSSIKEQKSSSQLNPRVPGSISPQLLWEMMRSISLLQILGPGVNFTLARPSLGPWFAQNWRSCSGNDEVWLKRPTSSIESLWGAGFAPDRQNFQ